MRCSLPEISCENSPQFRQGSEGLVQKTCEGKGLLIAALEAIARLDRFREPPGAGV
jgi:hypothetical protein